MIKTIRQLRTAYPYQFTAETYELGLPHGWFHRFSKLCREVDAMLLQQGMGHQGFHWTQVKEKLGTASFYFGAKVSVRKWIAPLTAKAESDTASMCICCGKPGSMDTHNGYMLALCDFHKTQRHAGLPMKIWPESEDEVILGDGS